MHPDQTPTPIALELLSDTELHHVAGGGITAEDDWEAPVCITATDDWAMDDWAMDDWEQRM